jgi:hypothetical protein
MDMTMASRKRGRHTGPFRFTFGRLTIEFPYAKLRWQRSDRKEITMTKEEAMKVAEALSERVDTCNTRVLAISPDGTQGIALIAPDCLLYSVLLLDGAMIYDAVMN